MGLFDIFKKDKGPDYDPLNIKITDLQQGFILDYDLKSWEITAVYDYDWGDECFSREYKIVAAGETAFLSVEDDDELILSISKKIKPRQLAEDLPEQIIKNEEPPPKLEFDGKTFLKDKESPGYFKDAKDKSEEAWTEFIAWDYYDTNNEYVITVEQWGEKEFEASYGKSIKEFEISNILPNE